MTRLHHTLGVLAAGCLLAAGCGDEDEPLGNIEGPETQRAQDTRRTAKTGNVRVRPKEPTAREPRAEAPRSTRSKRARARVERECIGEAEAAQLSGGAERRLEEACEELTPTTKEVSELGLDICKKIEETLPPGPERERALEPCEAIRAQTGE